MPQSLPGAHSSTLPSGRGRAIVFPLQSLQPACPGVPGVPGGLDPGATRVPHKCPVKLGILGHAPLGTPWGFETMWSIVGVGMIAANAKCAGGGGGQGRLTMWSSLEFAALINRLMGDKNPQPARPATPDAGLRIRNGYISQTARPAFLLPGNTSPLPPPQPAA